MGDACGLTGFQLGLGFSKPQKLSSIPDSGRREGGQIPYMKFAEHIIGIIPGKDRSGIPFPAYRVRTSEIADHCPFSVYTGGNRVRIASLDGFTIDTYPIGIINTVEITLRHSGPGPFFAVRHG